MVIKEGYWERDFNKCNFFISVPLKWDELNN